MSFILLSPKKDFSCFFFLFFFFFLLNKLTISLLLLHYVSFNSKLTRRVTTLACHCPPFLFAHFTALWNQRLCHNLAKQRGMRHDSKLSSLYSTLYRHPTLELIEVSLILPLSHLKLQVVRICRKSSEGKKNFGSVLAILLTQLYVII